jgi:3-oxoacyl-[acyl-carrier-protein] synthase-3
MRFQHVRIASHGTLLPERVVTSTALEDRLASLYARLNLVPGRLELSSGIRERRFFEPGTRPSTIAATAGARALAASTITRERVGCLVHGAVCRDFMEPATASVVHQALDLPPTCQAFDLSNACLGFANAMVVVGDMIERGTIEAGLVVSGEDGGPLVEETLKRLATDPSVDRAALKRAHASLTIGSGGVAFLLAHEDAAPADSPRLVGGATLTDTSANELCRGGVQAGGAGPLMETDSEALLAAGNALAARTWRAFLDELGWSAADVERIVTHQVGSAHRRLLFETLGLDTALDYPTVETLGNVGSVSLPLSFALAREAGFVRHGHRTALLGIGSGLSCLMLGVEA